MQDPATLSDVRSWDGDVRSRTGDHRVNALGNSPRGQRERQCYDAVVYAQKLKIQVIIEGKRRACPMEWLDQFCMRNFTNAAEFDDTLPTADGEVEASFRVKPEHFAEKLAAWLTQRGKGEGFPVKVEVTQS